MAKRGEGVLMVLTHTGMSTQQRLQLGEEKLDLLVRLLPATSVCSPGLGGCGLSSVVAVGDAGFSGDVSSLAACL